MTMGITKFLVSIATTIVLIGGATPASALSYSFSQSGFDGGGSLSGTFNGTDMNNDGWLDYSNSEITDFALSFSGESKIQAFNHGTIDLVGLVYKLGSGFIGDDGPDGAGELIGTLGSDNILYQSGKGLANSVSDLSASNISFTSQLVAVTVVPEPETYAFMAFGIALIALRLRQNPDKRQSIVANV